ncbi:hypothetical protein CesoFtcFv8_009047 [Champsocephalus esox]|uniref:Uncharacterized protein n=1 Tax=Champsocephalus esox TaxID=159716 RepID=A0AAN8H1A3_9TELE|nr:hypothetical protein CesoFtcFv8_009047 [Champsocephalus esox]
MDDTHAAPDQHNENLSPCPAEVNEELSPEELHGNQASGCYLSESPALEVADGRREHHRLGATVSTMDEPDEAAHTDLYSDTQLSSPGLDETNDPGDQKEDVVKVRMRKLKHARLDSMVLLLMKLDQLDQEIENALCATSSMGSTPTLHRRQLLAQEFEAGSVPAASRSPPHPYLPAASTSEYTPALGAIPKSGSTAALPETEKAVLSLPPVLELVNGS